LQSDYAYGDSGSPPKIPAKAVLCFEVELVDFGPKQKEIWELHGPEKVVEASKCKAQGNAEFKLKDYKKAAASCTLFPSSLLVYVFYCGNPKIQFLIYSYMHYLDEKAQDGIPFDITCQLLNR
jgi:hypothetical protein